MLISTADNLGIEEVVIYDNERSHSACIRNEDIWAQRLSLGANRRSRGDPSPPERRKTSHQPEGGYPELIAEKPLLKRPE